MLFSFSFSPKRVFQKQTVSFCPTVKWCGVALSPNDWEDTFYSLRGRACWLDGQMPSITDSDRVAVKTLPTLGRNNKIMQNQFPALGLCEAVKPIDEQTVKRTVGALFLDHSNIQQVIKMLTFRICLNSGVLQHVQGWIAIKRVFKCLRPLLVRSIK